MTERVVRAFLMLPHFEVVVHRWCFDRWEPPDPLTGVTTAVLLLWSRGEPFTHDDPLSRAFAAGYRRTNLRAPVIAVVGCGVTQAALARLRLSGVYDVLPLSVSASVLRVHVACAIARQWKVEDAVASRRLLCAILPEEVVSALKAGTGRVTHSHECVTVFFSDVVGFTDICARNDTDSVIEVLDAMFTAFDLLAETAGVFKVETIGDAYMAVCGHEEGTFAEQCTRVLRFAAAAVRALDDLPSLPDGERMRVRVGVHSGPASSGVIGATRPHFCFFGNCINYASRMESTSEPNRVHVSDAAATRRCSEVNASFESMPLGVQPGPEMTARGMVFLKGIGSVQTWWLAPPDPAGGRVLPPPRTHYQGNADAAPRSSSRRSSRCSREFDRPMPLVSGPASIRHMDGHYISKARVTL
jgi:class 3 adenylate cyclase